MQNLLPSTQVHEIVEQQEVIYNNNEPLEKSVTSSHFY